MSITNIVNSQTTYYVNGNDTSASDYNSGLNPNDAWKTLKRACMDTITPAAGDTIIILKGIYKESLIPKKTGITSGYITFRSDSAIISGYQLLDSVAEPDSTWQFETDTLWSHYNPVLTNVWKRKLRKNKSGYVEAYRDGQRMPSFKTLDGSGFILPLDSSVIYKNQVLPGTSYISDSLNTLYVFLENSIVSPNIYTWHVTKNNGILIKDRSFIDIQGFEVDSFAEVGIQIQNGNHIEIANNKVHYNGRTGIAVNWANSNISVTNNEVSYNGIGLGYSSGISVYKATSQSILISGNISHHNADSSSHFNNSDGNGFIIDEAADVGPNGGCILKNNIFYLNQGSGIRIHRSKNCKVINNTTFWNDADEMMIGDQIAPATPPDTTIMLDNIFIENNIFISKQNKYPFNEVFLHNASNIVSNYNNFYRNNADSTTAFFYVNDTVSLNYTGLINLGQFQSITTNDSNSIVADPLFVDWSNEDFHLTSGSPCIDAGNPDLNNNGQTWVTDTADQDPDSTRLDIGAYYFSQINNGIQNEHNVLFIIYPNPAYNSIFISNCENVKGIINVFDISGRLLHIQPLNNHNTEINISGLSKGLYILKISNSENMIIKRFVKQ